MKNLHRLRPYYQEIYACLVTLCSALIVFCFSALRFPNDDQFILYRYIDFIASGQGFVYNLGEKILGSTTPLFTLIGAGAKWVLPHISTPDLVAFLNIGFLAGSAILFSLIARKFLSPLFHILAVSVFALNLSKTVLEGMETPLFLLVVFAGLYFLLEERHNLAGVFVSLAVLTRPDAGLIAVIVFLYWLIRYGVVRAVRSSVVAVMVALPWFIFALSYFGSIIPQSLATKIHSADIYNIPALQAAKIQAAHISRIWWGRAFDYPHIPLQLALNFLPVVLSAVYGAYAMLKKHPLSWVIAGTPLAYFASFSLSNPNIFPWYLSEMEPFWILLATVGVASIADKVRSRLFSFALVAFLLIGPVYGYVSLATTHDAGSKQGFFQAASFIKERLEPGDRVGLTDIGIVGYVTGAPIIDYIGLVTPDSVGHYPLDVACVNKDVVHTLPSSLLKATEPEWLVITEAQLIPCLREDSWFSLRYDLVHETGVGGQRVYRRVEP